VMDHFARRPPVLGRSRVELLGRDPQQRLGHGTIAIPVLLDEFPSPRLRVYPREAVFAEKLEAITVLGIANSRMKDYFDLLALAREGEMATSSLSEAIRATFERRGTHWPQALPFGLSKAFADDAQKQAQWRAFLRRNRLLAPPLDVVIGEISTFIRTLHT